MTDPIADAVNELAKRNDGGQPSGTDETFNLGDAEIANNEVGFTATTPWQKEDDPE